MWNARDNGTQCWRNSCAGELCNINLLARFFLFSVLSLANYCSQSLCNLKLSFCTDISENTVVHLAKRCKR